MLRYLDVIDSDMSVFHRVDDIRAMASPRFFFLAERLVYYDGALRARLRLDHARMQTQPPAAGVAGSPSVVAAPPSGEVSPAVLAAMSDAGDAMGFPGIEFDQS